MNKPDFSSQRKALAPSRITPALCVAACALALTLFARELAEAGGHSLTLILLAAFILVCLAVLAARHFMRNAQTPGGEQAEAETSAPHPENPKEPKQAGSPPKDESATLVKDDTAGCDASGREAPLEQVGESGGSPELVQMSLRLRPLAPLFMKTAYGNARSIRQALAANDLKTVRRQGHSLKGAARTYGLDALGEWGLKVEQAAEDADVARLQGLIDGLDDYLGRMRVSFVREKDEKPGGRNRERPCGGRSARKGRGRSG